MKTRAKLGWVVVATTMLLTGTACEEAVEEAPPATAAPTAAATGSTQAAAADKKGDGKEGDKDKDAAPLRQLEFTEAEFVESEDTRDPFRDYSFLYVRKAETGPGPMVRKVKAAPFALDELKLVAIISRSATRVMMTDPTGFGWVLLTGDFVGKAELVSTGGTDAQEVPLNWRVDRIRPASVVFIREDAAHPEIPPTTREIPLYPADNSGS